MVLGLVCNKFRFDAEKSVVTVLPLFVVLGVSEGCSFCSSEAGTTFSGSDAATTVLSVLGTTSLGVLYMVVTVVPSLVVVPPPFRKGLPSGKSSMGMMFTGSDA